VAGPRFVDFDDDQAREQGGEAGEVEERVEEGACALLGGGVSGLEDEGGLGCEEEACGVEQGVRGEEDEVVGEDRAPDDCGEDEDAGLGDGRGAWGRGVSSGSLRDLRRPRWEGRNSGCGKRMRAYPAIGSSISSRPPTALRRRGAPAAARLPPRRAQR
jgi:hypothetical protein